MIIGLNAPRYHVGSYTVSVKDLWMQLLKAIIVIISAMITLSPDLFAEYTMDQAISKAIRSGVDRSYAEKINNFIHRYNLRATRWSVIHAYEGKIVVDSGDNDNDLTSISLSQLIDLKNDKGERFYNSLAPLVKGALLGINKQWFDQLNSLFARYNLKPPVSGYELNTFRESYDFECIANLGMLKNLDGNAMYSDSKQVIRTCKSKMDLNWAKRLIEITVNGNALFQEGRDLSYAWNEEITEDYISEMVQTFERYSQNVINFSANFVIQSKQDGVSADSLAGLLQVTDSKNIPLYQNINEILLAGRYKVSFEFVQTLARMSLHGKNIFRAEHINKIKNASVWLAENSKEDSRITTQADIDSMFELASRPFDFARTLINTFKNRIDCPDFTPKLLIRYFQMFILGLDFDKILFTDTEKPNALIVYPIRDNGDVFYSIPKTMEMFNGIIEEYDVEFVVAENENDLYQALERVGKIDLLILGGHGSKNIISLGDKDPGKNKIEGNEILVISKVDLEFADYFNKYLSDDAVIFLYSCSTGKDRDQLNFASFISRMAPERTIFSADEDLNLMLVEVINFNPFEVRLINEDGKDILYTIITAGEDG